MSSICESEHHTRYINEEHVKLLNWQYNTIQYFFDNKIANLKECYFIKDCNEKNISNWLGVEQIHNNYRNIDEPIEVYILRHTRLLPRDIVIIGNSLSEIKRLKSDSPNFDVCNLIRDKVSECARVFGNELLQICANQINNNEMPKDASNRGYSEVYTSIKEYKESTSQLIKNILLDINSDKLSWNQICDLNEKSKTILGENCRLFDVLWQNGGIGYLEEGPNGLKEKFFNELYPEFLLPKRKDTYILRSCLIDAVGMHSNNWDDRPVIGGNIE
jgi:hypothetical protein